MTRPYSDDLRERLATSVAAGRSCRETAALFDVSVSTVVRCSQRWRSSGSAAARPQGGARHPLILDAEREWLLARVAHPPQATLHVLQAELASRGVKASLTAIWSYLRRAGYSFKKKGGIRHRAAAREDRKAARALAAASAKP